MATKGIDATGIDTSPAQVQDAQQRWGHLPGAHRRLAPGGKLVFSHAPAVPGSYGVQGMYGNGFHGRQVWIYRWAYEPDTWTELLVEHGFQHVHAWIEPAAEPDHVGTLIVEARRGL